MPRGFYNKTGLPIKPPSWKGKKHTEETRKKIGKAHKGKLVLEETRVKMSKAKQGKKPWNYKLKGYKMPPCSIEKRRKIGEAQMGEKNHNWKGGVKPLREKIRNCFEYRLWRSNIFRRDNFTCVLCGVKSRKGKAIYLEADHYP